MIKVLFSILYFFKASTVSCHVDVEQGFERSRRHYKVKKYARLAPQVNESSGLAYLSDDFIYTHNDSGSGPVLYVININGELQDSIVVDIPNKDWESIDYNPEKELLYIADIGNNRNKRKDLEVHAFHPKTKEIKTYPLSYADQDSFPPIYANRNFDCEAIAYRDDKLFLFSKNRGTDRSTKQYTLDLSKEGEQNLEVAGQCLLHKHMVTAAAINSSGTILALLTYGKIYLFKIEENNPNLLSNPWRVIKCNRMRQSEGITFVNEDEMVFTNEQGRVFRVTPKK